MQTARFDRGVTLLGFLFVAVVLVVVIMVGARITPAVIEYYSIKTALDEALSDTKDPTVLPDIQRAFQKRIDAGYIESVSSKDVEIHRNGNAVTANVNWTRTMHLVANASLLLEFEASATR